MSIPSPAHISALKAANPESLLLFGDGDRFTVFGVDAEKAAFVLGLALVSHDSETLETSFPRAALESNLARLVQAGHAAAVCEEIVERNGQPVRADIVRMLWEEAAEKDQVVS